MTNNTIDNNQVNLAQKTAQLSHFLSRTDCYAESQPDGQYYCIKQPLTNQVLAAHINGARTIGAYTINPDDQSCRYLCADVDAHDEPKPENRQTAELIAHKLREFGLKPFIEDSNGKGGFHIWVLFSTPAPAEAVYGLGRWLAEEFDCEVFPKQDAVKKDGFGNLVRLPHGKHPKTGYPSRLLTGIQLSDPANIPPELEQATTDKDFSWCKRYKGDLHTLDILKLCEDRYVSHSGNHWHTIQCPWEEQHTTGPYAGIRIQDEGFPAFRCLHHHCEGRKLKDLLATYPATKVDQCCTKQIVRLSETTGTKDNKPPVYDGLPPIVRLGGFLAKPLPEPTQLIKGALHKGCKLALGGTSKSYKTWTFLDLACGVACGDNWIGFDCEQGRVLYLNFEIQDWAIQRRLNTLAFNRRNLARIKDNIDLWNLRGHAASYDTILPIVSKRIEAEKYDLLIIDPIYKLYGEKTDENGTTAVAQLMNGLEVLAVENDVAVAFAAHFAKGDPSKKTAMDRISGSGVFARDPDTIITFTPHVEDDCYTIDTIVRNNPPVSPYVAQWVFPQWQKTELDPKCLKTPTSQFKLSDFVTAYNEDHHYKSVMEKLGCSKTQYYNMREAAINANMLA